MNASACRQVTLRFLIRILEVESLSSNGPHSVNPLAPFVVDAWSLPVAPQPLEIPASNSTKPIIPTPAALHMQQSRKKQPPRGPGCDGAVPGASGARLFRRARITIVRITSRQLAARVLERLVPGSRWDRRSR